MPLPHSFLPGDVARSSDVNDNFAYIISILGAVSTPSRVITSTEFQMGFRSNALLTGTSDTGSADASGRTHNYFQIGWNADYNLVSGTWRFARFISNTGAGAFRIGNGEFSFIGTTTTTGSLDGAMDTYMKIKESSGGSYVFLDPAFSFQRYDGTARTVGDYRLMYTPFSSPAMIYDGSSLSTATVDKTAANFGVPTAAVAVTINCTGTAASSSGKTQIRFMQKRGSGSPGTRYGFSVSAGLNRYASGQGIVVLGTGTNAGKFTVERTQPFDAMSAWISGYWM